MLYIREKEIHRLGPCSLRNFQHFETIIKFLLIQGLLNAQNGQQLNLSTLGNSALAKQVKTKACDLVLKQGVNFIA